MEWTERIVNIVLMLQNAKTRTATPVTPNEYGCPSDAQWKIMRIPKLVRYESYRQALLATDTWRSEMATAILAWPDEIQIMLLKALVVVMLPQTMNFGARSFNSQIQTTTTTTVAEWMSKATEKPFATRVDTFDSRTERAVASPIQYYAQVDANGIPPHIPGPSAMEAAIHLLLSGLCKAQPRPQPLSISNVQGAQRSNLIITADTAPRAGGMHDQLVEAILKTVIIKYPAEFPTKVAPERRPFPRCLAGHVLWINSLWLTVALNEPRPTGSELYSTNLFRAQDGIPEILKYAPNLRFLLVQLVEHAWNLRVPHATKYRARLGRGGGTHTTLKDEVGVLVETLRGLGTVKQRSLRYDRVYEDDDKVHSALEDCDARLSSIEDAAGKVMEEGIGEVLV